MAEQKIAVVIGNGAYAGAPLDQPARDAIDVSRSLLGIGFDVIRVQDLGQGEPLPQVGAAAQVALYFSGRTQAVAGDTYLLPAGPLTPPAEGAEEAVPGVSLSTVLDGLRASGAAEVLVFVEGCHGAPGAAPVYAPPEVDPGTILAFSAAPGVPCGPPGAFTEALIAALATPDAPLQETLEDIDGVWLRSTASPLVLWSAQDRPEGLSQSDLDMLDRLSEEDRARMLALWRSAGIIDGEGEAPAIATVQSDTILLTDPVAPVDLSASAVAAAPVVLPAAAPPSRPGQVVDDGVEIFAVDLGPRPAALPTGTGLPTPSIIVGELQPTEAAFTPTETLGSLSGTELGVDLDARRGLRDSDPELFERLVADGAFDPPQGDLARAIQAELARMNCYTVGIDGVWGPGSRASVDRFYQQVGSAPPSREPTVELFRETLREDAVTCPPVQVAAPSAPARPAAPQTSTPRPAATPAAPAPAPAPAQPTERTINSGTLGTGLFR